MRALLRRFNPLMLCAALVAASAYAQTATVLGYWREPRGSIIRIVPCDQRLCIEIAELPPGNRHPAVDGRNPDPKLRTRPLCGLRIGDGFVQVDPQHASGGHLYDPRSGRTYSGEMTADGNLLHLRGYVGLRIFGRTATWARASQPPPCRPQRQAAPAPAPKRARYSVYTVPVPSVPTTSN
ncbi:MAG: DUF2147 domain-containing protein [Gammaproteobacteria bacterium]|nr:DUF2147 domain-containing protein [Gammaproteobacteria bacterium]